MIEAKRGAGGGGEGGHCGCCLQSKAIGLTRNNITSVCRRFSDVVPDVTPCVIRIMVMLSDTCLAAHLQPLAPRCTSSRAMHCEYGGAVSNISRLGEGKCDLNSKSALWFPHLKPAEQRVSAPKSDKKKSTKLTKTLEHGHPAEATSTNLWE